jgi:hypothetical protein
MASSSPKLWRWGGAALAAVCLVAGCATLREPDVAPRVAGRTFQFWVEHQASAAPAAGGDLTSGDAGLEVEVPRFEVSFSEDANRLTLLSEEHDFFASGVREEAGSSWSLRTVFGAAFSLHQKGKVLRAELVLFDREGRAARTLRGRLVTGGEAR